MGSVNFNKKTLIYVIYDPLFPKQIRYVGKTCQTLKSRLGQHFSATKHCTKNHFLYNWIKSKNYKIEIKQIDEHIDWTKGEQLEIYYIDKFKKEGHKLCNMTIGGDGATPKYKNENNNAKKVLQYDLDGNFIALYDSRVEAEEITGVKASLICGCINIERVKSAGGFIWKKYKKDFPKKISSYKEITLGIKDNNHIKKISKQVSQYNQKGELINTFRSLHEMEKITKFSRPNIARAIKTNKKSNGFYWKITNF